MLAFLDRYAGQAQELGWTDLDPLGVHPQIGIYQPDFCGALVQSQIEPRAITTDTVSFDRTTFYRSTPGRSCGVPLWAFKGRVLPWPYGRAILHHQRTREGDCRRRRDALIRAYAVNPGAGPLPLGDGYKLDVDKEIDAHPQAAMAVNDPASSERWRRTAIRTAILLARPVKA